MMHTKVCSFAVFLLYCMRDFFMILYINSIMKNACYCLYRNKKKTNSTLAKTRVKPSLYMYVYICKVCEN